MDNLNEDPPFNGARIPNDRLLIGLEATSEIEQINATIRELCEEMLPHNETGSPLRLRIRGLTARINDLVRVAMSVLDEDGDIDDLSLRVHGATVTRPEAGRAEENRNAH